MTFFGIAAVLISRRVASTGRSGFTFGHVACSWLLLVLCVLYDLGVR